MGNKPTNNHVIEEIIVADEEKDGQNTAVVGDNEPLPSNIPSSDEIDPNFKIHVGIDFGTDGCGLAYAFNHASDDNNISLHEDQTVKIHTNFKDARGPYDKTRTAVLLDANNSVQSVGGDAANIFVQMNHNDDWKLFERF
eukprot:1163811_1